MKLKTFSYKDADWSIENLQLDEVGLIVGKNATGKSRTLSIISKLVALLKQGISLEASTEWRVSFVTGEGTEVNYHFISSDLGEKVIYEEIVYGGEIVFLRDEEQAKGSATIKNYLNDQEEVAYPPTNKLVIHTVRDVRKFPFLEEIAFWAENTYSIDFGSIHPLTSMVGSNKDIATVIGELPTQFEGLSQRRKEEVERGLKVLGYEVETIQVVNSQGLHILYLKEENVEEKLIHFDVSQGMYRALVALTTFQRMLSLEQTTTLLIDDLCEGLDYARATKLGKLLYETALENNIQLIATSNDSFLMDVVDLKYWNVLIREGSEVRGINTHSHPKIFEEFKFTGLSNFDFFSSSYLKSALK